MTADARCALGAYAVRSLSQPKAYLPALPAVCSTADESVFCISTSAPPLMSDCAAAVSFGGSHHFVTQTTRRWIFVFTYGAPSVKLLMLRTTSGIGTEPTTPSVFVFVIPPAMTP